MLTHLPAYPVTRAPSVLHLDGIRTSHGATHSSGPHFVRAVNHCRLLGDGLTGSSSAVSLEFTSPRVSVESSGGRIRSEFVVSARPVADPTSVVTCPRVSVESSGGRTRPLFSLTPLFAVSWVTRAESDSGMRAVSPSMGRYPAAVSRFSADAGAVAARGARDRSPAGAVSPAAAPVPAFSLACLVVSVVTGEAEVAGLPVDGWTPFVTAVSCIIVAVLSLPLSLRSEREHAAVARTRVLAAMLYSSVRLETGECIDLSSTCSSILRCAGVGERKEYGGAPGSCSES
jgi:hypothetical protein